MDLAKLKAAVGDLDEDLVMEMLDEFIAGKPGDEETQQVVAACQQGMEIVGDLYDQGRRKYESTPIL